MGSNPDRSCRTKLYRQQPHSIRSAVGGSSERLYTPSPAYLKLRSKRYMFWSAFAAKRHLSKNKAESRLLQPTLLFSRNIILPVSIERSIHRISVHRPPVSRCCGCTPESPAFPHSGSCGRCPTRSGCKARFRRFQNCNL